MYLFEPSCETRKFYLIGILFALLSSIRLPFLPELQFVLVICYILYRKNIDYRVIMLLCTILCTHHYVIPDNIYRFNSSEYPSIYTRAYGPLKILDILIVLLFCLSFKKIKCSMLKFFREPHLPTFIILTSCFGFIFLKDETFALNNFLFIARSYLLFFVVFSITLNFSRNQYVTLSKLAVFLWILKMVGAILIPHNAPLYREILGIPGIIYFAGDEYLTIPYYLAFLILLDSKLSIKIVSKILLAVLLLALIAQRKGAISVLFPFWIVCYAYIKQKSILSFVVKIYYLFSSFLIITFLTTLPFLVNDPLVILAFEEYSAIAQVSIDSIKHIWSTNPFAMTFGISPFGKYEIINLPSIYDHPMSFGEEVGEKYRYMLWSFPYGRCILNVGLLGFICVLFFAVKNLRLKAPLYYLTYSGLAICYVTNLTPILAFAMGFVFSFILNYSKKIIYTK